MTGDGERDPVERELGDSEDLYDVATWAVRSRLDRLAVAIYAALPGSGRAVLVFLALVLFLAQLAAGGYVLFVRPALGALTLLSAVPALVLTAFFWREDATDHEPLGTLAATFLLSVLFAGFAALANSALRVVVTSIPVVGFALFFYLVVGPTEETVKLLAVRIHAYRTRRFAAVVDGAVYGAVAGLGFATIENSLYIAQAFLAASEPSEGAAVVLAAATQRAFVGPGHVIYSGFAGYYLGLAKFNRADAGPIVVKGVLVAAFVHATYNALVTYLPLTAGTFVVFVVAYDGLFGYLLYRKLARYRAKYRRATRLADVEAETATDTDVEAEAETEVDAGTESESESERFRS